MPTDNDKTKVSNSTIYSELSSELRRYRDYELTAATWYTAILLAILGFYISAPPDNNGKSEIIEFSILVLSTVLGFCSCYSIWFAHKRYSAIWKIINTHHLEPKWKIEAFKPLTEEKPMPPRCLIYLIQFILVSVTWLVVCHPR